LAAPALLLHSPRHVRNNRVHPATLIRDATATKADHRAAAIVTAEIIVAAAIAIETGRVRNRRADLLNSTRLNSKMRVAMRTDIPSASRAKPASPAVKQPNRFRRRQVRRLLLVRRRRVRSNLLVPKAPRGSNVESAVSAAVAIVVDVVVEAVVEGRMAVRPARQTDSKAMAANQRAHRPKAAATMDRANRVLSRVPRRSRASICRIRLQSREMNHDLSRAPRAKARPRLSHPLPRQDSRGAEPIRSPSPCGHRAPAVARAHGVVDRLAETNNVDCLIVA
jgi:hypothetical protein